jgi:hypothetical protein
MTALTTLVPRGDWDARFADAHPAFAALAPYAARFASCAAWPDIDRWNSHLADLPLAAASGAPLRFVPQAPRRRGKATPAAERYECRVHDRGEVPSRARSWHDFFNMLCWATFPRAKAALNRRQRAAVARLDLDGATRLPNARTREQDALAMLDEGGCGILTTRPLDAPVARGDVDAVEAAVRDGEARVVVLGHAVYEHLVSSDAVVRALAVVVPVHEIPARLDAVVAQIDAGVAAALADDAFLAAPPPHAALPMRRSLFEAP